MRTSADGALPDDIVRSHPAGGAQAGVREAEVSVEKPAADGSTRESASTDPASAGIRDESVQSGTGATTDKEKPKNPVDDTQRPIPVLDDVGPIEEVPVEGNTHGKTPDHKTSSGYEVPVADSIPVVEAIVDQTAPDANSKKEEEGEAEGDSKLVRPRVNIVLVKEAPAGKAQTDPERAHDDDAKSSMDHAASQQPSAIPADADTPSAKTTSGE